MRFIACLSLLALPLAALSAQAASLSDCDGGSYDIIVRNGDSARQAKIGPHTGPIYEYGPVVSFQIVGGREMKATLPDEEFCIWSGRINVQRLDTHGTFPSGM